MIVEYLGIPGSGKTYQTRLYKDQLSKDGVKYIDISRYSGMPFWLKMFYKFADYAILILPKYRNQIADYREICKNCPKEPTFVPLSLGNCIKDVVLYSFVNDVFCHSRKVVVNDEGQLHRVLFLVAQYNCSLTQVIDIYLSNKHDGTVRYVNTSVENAFQNIKKRNRKVCPMDEMNDKLLMEYIKTFKNLCDEVIRKTPEIEVI